MKIIFTCGGTGGHIYPAIAVANMLKQRKPDCEILFIGAEEGLETKLIPREGFRLETIRISSFQRKFTPSAIWHNIRTLANMAGALRKAGKIIDRFEPDIIVGMGGYASYPALKMGAKKHVPTIVHESNAVPGLTTRMVEKNVTAVMVSFEESRKYYSYPERVIVTGTPVREEFLYTKKQEAKKTLGLDDRPVIVSFWGSLGAREMNKKIAEFFVLEQKDGSKYQHIHACGSYGWRWMPQLCEDLHLHLSEQNSINIQEFIFDMPDMMAAADLVICRAGAATIAEIAASGTPCIMVPSPNVTEHHQEKNAKVLEDHGAAVVLSEEKCTGKSLYEAAKKILDDPETGAQIAHNVQALAVVDSAEQILNTIIRLKKTR